jgi:hypothetical protein
LKNFGQKRIQKYICFYPRKIEEGATGVNFFLKKIDRFILTQEHNGFILFAPASSPPAHPLITHGEVFHDLRSNSSAVNFRQIGP